MKFDLEEVNLSSIRILMIAYYEMISEHRTNEEITDIHNMFFQNQKDISWSTALTTKETATKMGWPVSNLFLVVETVHISMVIETLTKSKKLSK